MIELTRIQSPVRGYPWRARSATNSPRSRSIVPTRELSGGTGTANLGRRRGGGGLRLLVLVALADSAGHSGGRRARSRYRQYEQMRSRPEVTIGLVQRMTTGEAAKLLTAKGYLKSRYQAMIGTKIAGRVEQMCVEEGMKVKKGDTLAVIEHNDLKAMLASREAQSLRTAGRAGGSPGRPLGEGARGPPGDAGCSPEERHSRGIREGAGRAQEGGGAGCGPEAAVKLMKANIEEIKATIATMHLYAPFDGTVVEKQGEEGEIITPTAMSSSLGRTAVVTIANLEKMDVETDISEGPAVAGRRWASRPRSPSARFPRSDTAAGCGR